MIGGLAPHRFERDGVGLAAWSGGSGPTVLLLHGYPQSSYMWREVAARLLGAHHVVVMDLRGYGQSDAPPPDPDDLTYSKREMAADAAFVLDSLGVDRAHLVGHDRGGRVVHRFCLDFPELVLTAAVLDIVPTLHMSSPRPGDGRGVLPLVLPDPARRPARGADPRRARAVAAQPFRRSARPGVRFDEHVGPSTSALQPPRGGRGDLLGLPRGRLGRFEHDRADREAGAG